MTTPKKPPRKNPGLRLVTAGESGKLPGKKPARAAKPAKPGKLPGKTPPKALPKGKTPKAPKGRRQSTKKARPTGKEVPPAPPVVDPMIVPLRQVADWILRGENEISIQEAIKATFPDLDAVELLVAAFKYIGELAETDPELRRTWHIAARRELYRRTIEIHDFKTARDILRDLGQFEGLYPKMSPTKTKKGHDQAEPVEDGIPTAEGFPVQ
jgi:hypothetical protein